MAKGKSMSCSPKVNPDKLEELKTFLKEEGIIVEKTGWCVEKTTGSFLAILSLLIGGKKSLKFLGQGKSESGAKDKAIHKAINHMLPRNANSGKNNSAMENHSYICLAKQKLGETGTKIYIGSEYVNILEYWMKTGEIFNLGIDTEGHPSGNNTVCRWIQISDGKIVLILPVKKCWKELQQFFKHPNNFVFCDKSADIKRIPWISNKSNIFDIQSMFCFLNSSNKKSSLYDIINHYMFDGKPHLEKMRGERATKFYGTFLRYNHAHLTDAHIAYMAFDAFITLEMFNQIKNDMGDYWNIYLNYYLCHDKCYDKYRNTYYYN